MIEKLFKEKIDSYSKQNARPASDLIGDLPPPSSTPYKVGIPKDSISV